VAEVDPAEPELMHRMRARYQRIEDRYFSAVGVRHGQPDVYEVMAALADEVRAYDREQAAKAAPKTRRARRGEPPGLYLEQWEETSGG
jgi:hypothetical protein